MNRIVGVFLLGAVVSLSACGGDSDSSGSYSSSNPDQFNELSSCKIVGNNIIVDNIGSCLVKKSNINNGKKFSLSCQIRGLPNLPGGQTPRFGISSEKGGDPEAVKRDIERNPNGKYSYECREYNNKLSIN